MLEWATQGPAVDPGQSQPLTSGEGTEPTPLRPCHQGQFFLTSGEGWGRLSLVQGQLSCCTVHREAGPADPCTGTLVMVVTQQA